LPAEAKERDVPMQPDARAALEEQLEEDGKLWRQNPQRLREVLAEGSARAKIPSLTPHVLRHHADNRIMPTWRSAVPCRARPHDVTRAVNAA
jgi:integrase